MHNVAHAATESCENKYAEHYYCENEVFMGRKQQKKKHLLGYMAWDTACDFNVVILNQTIFNCLITSVSILYMFIFFILIASSFVYMQK